MRIDHNSEREIWIKELISPIGNDLLSGAAELALQAINIFQSILSTASTNKPEELRQELKLAAQDLLDAQPAMAPFLI